MIIIEEEQLIKEDRHIRNAWIAGSISAIVTFIYSLIGAYSESVKFKYGCDTWSLLDVALIAGLTYGIYRKNRFCALGMLVYVIISKFIIAASTGKFTGGLMVIIFGYFFFQGTRATFILHKQRTKVSGQNARKKRSLVFYVGMCILAIIVISVGIFFTMAAFGPGTEVVPGKMLNKKYVNYIREKKLIEPSEQIEFWYSDALSDFRNGFYLFTNKQVLLYCKNWEEPSISLPYSSIIDIQFQNNPSFFEDSKITILLSDSSTVFFPLSSDNNGDRRFFERLKQVWAKEKHIDVLD